MVRVSAAAIVLKGSTWVRNCDMMSVVVDLKLVQVAVGRFVIRQALLVVVIEPSVAPMQRLSLPMYPTFTL